MIFDAGYVQAQFVRFIFVPWWYVDQLCGLYGCVVSASSQSMRCEMKTKSAYEWTSQSYLIVIVIFCSGENFLSWAVLFCQGTEYRYLRSSDAIRNAWRFWLNWAWFVLSVWLQGWLRLIELKEFVHHVVNGQVNHVETLLAPPLCQIAPSLDWAVMQARLAPTSLTLMSHGFVLRAVRQIRCIALDSKQEVRQDATVEEWCTAIRYALLLLSAVLWCMCGLVSCVSCNRLKLIWACPSCSLLNRWKLIWACPSCSRLNCLKLIWAFLAVFSTVWSWSELVLLAVVSTVWSWSELVLLAVVSTVWSWSELVLLAVASTVWSWSALFLAGFSTIWSQLDWNFRCWFGRASHIEVSLTILTKHLCPRFKLFTLWRR